MHSCAFSLTLFLVGLFCLFCFILFCYYSLDVCFLGRGRKSDDPIRKEVGRNWEECGGNENHQYNKYLKKEKLSTKLTKNDDVCKDYLVFGGHRVHTAQNNGLPWKVQS